MRIAKEHNLFVVEDCACAVGTTYKGIPVGVIGDVGCFSFHPRKVITTGEGGICCTNSENLSQKIQQYRNHGANISKCGSDFGKPYYLGVFDDVGYNLRMSDIQAAVGVAQLSKLGVLLDDRRKTASWYIKHLNNNEKIILPEMKDGFGHTFQSFVIRVNANKAIRNRIMEILHGEGIQTRPGTIAIHRTEFNKCKYSILEQDFPIACICEDTSITLPIYPFMPVEKCEQVLQALLSALDLIDT